LSRGPWKKKPEENGIKPPPKPEVKAKEKQPVKSSSGTEIIPGVVLEANRLKEEKEKAASEVEGEVLDLTDDELRELLGILFQEGGNLLLRIMKRQLINEREAAVFGKLSLPYWRAKLKEKVNLGLTGPLLFAGLVIVSKPLTPEEIERRKKLKQEEDLKKGVVQK
jgi:hypothetical protein